jgi:Uri superfamily endonuclease
MNLLGEVVFKNSYIESEFDIDISQLQKGIYYYAGSGIETFKGKLIKD